MGWQVSFKGSPLVLLVLLVLTFVLGYFSLSTRFDANLANINYMTEEQPERYAVFPTAGILRWITIWNRYMWFRKVLLSMSFIFPFCHTRLFGKFGAPCKR